MKEGKSKQAYYDPSQKVLPPDKFKDRKWHWLHSERSWGPAMAEWVNGKWYSAGEVENIEPEELYRRGWRYYGPVQLPLEFQED